MTHIKIAKFVFLVLILALFVTTQTFATTWQIERDGSGDFALFQAGIDAAASGDTLLIRSG